MYSTVLWATDGSPESDHALEHALTLLDPGGRLVAFHCDQRFLGGRAAGLPVLPDEQDRLAHIEAQVGRARNDGVVVDLMVERTTSEPASEIAASAEKVGADAIVCGTRSLHGLLGVVQGSVAARVLRHATAPVVVVPARVESRAVAHV